MGPANGSSVHELALANRILTAKGVLDEYGHVSVRQASNPNYFLLARSLAPALVTDADIMTFDLDSNPVGDDTRQPYSERFLHSEIYRVRPDVNAIIHCHTPEILPFANTNVPLRAMSNMSAFLNAGVPVYEVREFRATNQKSMLVLDRQTGRGLACVLGDKSVALLRGHGAVVVGPTLGQTVGRGVNLKSSAAAQAIAMMLSKEVKYLDCDELGSDYARAWHLWLTEAETAYKA